MEDLKQENERLKEEILKWQKAYSRQYQINENKGYNKKEEQYRQTLQEIKGVVTALYMNNWLQMNETARKSIQLLQELITKAESEGSNV